MSDSALFPVVDLSENDKSERFLLLSQQQAAGYQMYVPGQPMPPSVPGFTSNAPSDDGMVNNYMCMICGVNFITKRAG